MFDGILKAPLYRRKNWNTKSIIWKYVFTNNHIPDTIHLTLLLL